MDTDMVPGTGDTNAIATDPGPMQPLAGNTADDDGQAIDEFFEPNPGLDSPVSGIATEVVDLPIKTRILSRIIPLDPANDTPVLAFPPNAKRKSLRIVGRGGIATNVGNTFTFRIASDLSDLYGAGVIPSGEVWGIDNQHTGAVWLLCRVGDAPSAFNVNVEQVTE